MKSFYLKVLDKNKWKRPADWLPIAHLVNDGEEKFVGLFAVMDSSSIELGFNNYCTAHCSGHFTIDWGDGTIENYIGGSIAEHEYTYSSISDETNCSRGYKQVIITITPQSGSNLAYINLGQRHSEMSSFGISNWLDIKISGTSITRVMVFHSYIRAVLLEQIKVYQTTSACTSCLSMFAYCSSLQSVDLSNFNTSEVVSMSSMFSNCFALKSIDVSNFDTSVVTDMSMMFYMCTSLEKLDLSNFDTSQVTTMYYMFAYCMNTIELNLSSFDTSAVTNMQSMFYNLNLIQILDVSNFNTSSVTIMYAMFYGCRSLLALDLTNFDTSVVTSIGYFFYGCFLLKYFKISTKFVTNLVTSALYMFGSCYTLDSIDLSFTSLANLSNGSNITQNCYSLTECRLPDIGITFSVADSNMDASALNALFEDLKDLSGKTAQSITISGCPGASGCDKTIATAKNWTVIN